MTEKKPILLLASAAALTLALHESALYASPLGEPETPVAAPQITIAEPASPAAASTGSSPALPTQGPAGTPAPVSVDPETAASATPEPPTASPPPLVVPAEVLAPAPTWPATAGGIESQTPTQMPTAGSSEPRLGDMTPEERSALRQQHFQEMRDRVMKRRQDVTERWDSYWKTLDAMTAEQKEAVHAIFGPEMNRCAHRAKSNQMQPRTPMPPRFGQPEPGFPSGSAFPGYGYGPQGSEPYPYERGPAASWFGEQPMYPAGPQPWYGLDQAPFQGPPPPGGDHPQP